MVSLSMKLFHDLIDSYNAKPMDDDRSDSSPTKDDEKKKSKKAKKDREGEDEETKGTDFGEVQLSDKAYTPQILEEESSDFSVTNPVLQNGRIVYTVKGVDRSGVWEGTRRYNEFYVLHNVL